MGTYHLMGLGRSAGTVIGPLTYLAHRYRRWNEDDQRFFARSGEARQREAGEKVGDVQAIVLFTTREILTGELSTFSYVDNPAGRIAKKPQKAGGAMKDVLRTLLRCEWPAISSGRPKGAIFWCEVHRRDIHTTYKRVIQIVAALAGVGGQGKEMWVNLTGGNNVINLALELATALSGAVARMYYVQAENPAAEKCVRYTAENGYWVDLPVMPLALGRLNHAILDLLQQDGPLDLRNLHSKLLTHEAHWSLVQGVSPASLEELYMTPMWKQGLIVEASNGYIAGPQWDLIRPYEESWQQARASTLTIEKLAEQETWLEREELDLG